MSQRRREAILASIEQSCEQKNGVGQNSRAHQDGRCLPQWHRVTLAPYTGPRGLTR